MHIYIQTIEELSYAWWVVSVDAESEFEQAIQHVDAGGKSNDDVFTVIPNLFYFDKKPFNSII